jgi:hypothetical protein
LNFFKISRHFFTGPAVDDLHMAVGTHQTFGGPRSIHRRIAATDHHDILAQIRYLAAAHGTEETDLVVNTRCILTGDA